MLKITAKLLKAKDACATQVRLFRRRFGAGPAPLNKKTALAVASVFDWGWAAYALLPDPQWQRYQAAIERARRAKGKAIQRCEERFYKRREPLWERYYRTGQDQRTLERALQPHWKACVAERTRAWKAFDQAKALEFLKQAKRVKA